MITANSSTLKFKNFILQLGFVKSRRDNVSSRVSGSGFHRASSNQDTIIPTELRALPESDVSDAMWTSLLASLSVDNAWVCVNFISFRLVQSIGAKKHVDRSLCDKSTKIGTNDR